MSNLNLIGLNTEKSEKVANDLNLLLSNFQLYYQNLRGFHWNIKGNNFFELHTKFEELYNEAAVNIDLIAERILTLGFTPLHDFSDYLSKAEIKSSVNITEANKSVETVLENIKTLMVNLRNTAESADSATDSGTVDLVEDIISSFEKTTWMLNAWLG